jgi:multidrug resistance efflux pump
MALARTLAHSHIRALALARAPALALRPVASPAARALVHSTASAAYPPKATSDTTNLAKGAGSGKGSRADKDRARADRERARADRERAKADREKVRAARASLQLPSHSDASRLTPAPPPLPPPRPC